MKHKRLNSLCILLFDPGSAVGSRFGGGRETSQGPLHFGG